MTGEKPFPLSDQRTLPNEQNEQHTYIVFQCFALSSLKENVKLWFHPLKLY